MLVDLVNQCQNSASIVPTAWTVTTQGTPIDMSNCEISTNAIVNVGAFSAQQSTAVVQIEEGTATNGSFTLIPGMIATITGSNQLAVLRGLRTQRYARANFVTNTGTTPSVALGAVLVSQLKISGAASGVSRSPST